MKFQLKNEEKILLDLLKSIANPIKYSFDFNRLQNISWNTLMDEARQQKVFPMIFRYVNNYMPEEYLKIYSIRYSEFTDRINMILKELNEVSKIAEKRNVHFLIFKGLAFSKIIYDDLFMRQLLDCDILVHEKDMQIMDKVVREAGFSQYYESAKSYKSLPFPLLKNSYMHEYFEYQKRNSTCTYTVVEIARFMHLIREDHIDEFMNFIQNIKLNDLTVKTFDTYHTLLSIIENTFFNSEPLSEVAREGKTNLRDYIDLYVFYNRYNDLEWRKIKELALRYGILNEIICVFNNLYQLFKEKWMQEILEYLKENFNFNLYPFINWDLNFTERIFNFNERKKEAASKFKQKIFCNSNCYFEKPYLVETNEELMTNFKQYIELKNSCDFDIRYYIAFADGRLQLLIYMDDLLYSSLDDYIIEFELYINDTEYPIPNNFIILYSREKNICSSYYNNKQEFSHSRIIHSNCCFDNNAEIVNSIVELDKGKLIRICYSIRDLDVKSMEPSTSLGCSITLQKKVYENIFHRVSTNKKGVFGIPIFEIKELNNIV